LIKAQAVQNAELYIQSFNEAINLYSEKAADRVRAGNTVKVTHAYMTDANAIPLPSTFAIELGDQISERDSRMTVRLYSDFPFPSRRKGGARDAFERDALVQLRKRPKDPYYVFEQQDGQLTLRYGEASVMKASCVACHNSDPKSPKKDWDVGDVGGVWEVSQRLDLSQIDQKLKGTFTMLSGISVLGVCGLTLVVGKLRQTATDLEIRVHDRTVDLTQANLDLGKRNQLIRQIFGRYLSDRVVETLLDRPEGLALGGERRKITILTSDLRGFSALSEQLDPEVVIDILNHYLRQMTEVINHYQGTIDELMGDGILVLFGAPIAQQDDALRAVACACAMQLAMGAVNEHLRSTGLSDLEMGIGIHTGEVVVGNIGSERRTKYGVVGSPVNLAYRIESYTKGGQILISEQTRQAVGANVKISGQYQVQPKGLNQPIVIYEVYGVSGSHNLFLPKSEEVFVTLPDPISIQYTVIQGKHLDRAFFAGQLTQLSPTGAKISTVQEAPAVFANLKIQFAEFNEEAYAKVAESGDADGFYLDFTRLPAALRTWLNQLYRAYLN
jgi:adenylate cyclase